MKESYLPDAINLAMVDRVLVIKLRHHGDVLLTSPVFSVLANHKPGIEIDALLYADTAPMMAGHPDLSQLHVIDRSWKKQGLLTQWREERRLMTALQNRHYDLIIHLTESARGARLVRRLRPRHSVAQRYPGKRGRWWQKLFTHTYGIPDSPRHMVEVHLDALRRLGIYPQPDERDLVLVAGNEATQRVAELMQQHDLEPDNYLLIHPTSRWMFKGWSQEGFAEVMAHLHSMGHKLVLTSAPEAHELEVVDEILTRIPDLPMVNLAGQLNLKELSLLIKNASAFIGLDSVPMHIAAAMNTPVVALFGPSNEKIWGPWQVRNIVLAEDFSCRPCGLDGCGNGKLSDCLMAINAEEVVSAVQQLLSDQS